MKPKVFRSRVSILLLIFITVATGSAMIPHVPEMIRTQDWTMLIPEFVMVPVIASLFGFRYIVTDGKLLVRWCGIPAGNVVISGIYSVERTYNPIASSAASLKRLAVYTKTYNPRLASDSGYLKLAILLSPAREQEFLDTLKALNPSIRIHVTDKKGFWRFWDWDLSGYAGIPFKRLQRK
ncbi:MAG: PH domain-containing protein [Tannerella sp.]|jgi:hypothetical protein|nr:PH domain-containing protein [Tannerella sp.]